MLKLFYLLSQTMLSTFDVKAFATLAVAFDFLFTCGMAIFSSGNALKNYINSF